MMKKSIISVTTAALIGVAMVSGCAQTGVPEYEGSSYDQIKRFEVGTVVSTRPVVIKDDGIGTMIGTITGVVLGSFVGGGRASALGTLGGGLAGAYVGSEAGRANAQELVVELEYGDQAVIVVKGVGVHKAGDRIRIIKDGNKVATVEKLDTVPSQ